MDDIPPLRYVAHKANNLSIGVSHSYSKLDLMQAALIQLTNWALYLAGIWWTYFRVQHNNPASEGFGQAQHEQSWNPVWCLSRACQELLKCWLQDTSSY